MILFINFFLNDSLNITPSNFIKLKFDEGSEGNFRVIGFEDIFHDDNFSLLRVFARN